MNRDLDPNDLRALRGEDRETPGQTFDDRKRLERRTRLSGFDARRDRPVTPLLQINFGMEPSEKARMVHACKLRDVKIADFLRQAVRDALDKLEAE